MPLVDQKIKVTFYNKIHAAQKPRILSRRYEIGGKQAELFLNKVRTVGMTGVSATKSSAELWKVRVILYHRDT
jgi:hypothetical protein